MVKVMSLGAKLSVRKVVVRVLRKPQMKASSSTGRTGIKPNVM